MPFYTVPWFPDLTEQHPQMTKQTMHFVFMAAILSYKLGAATVSTFDAQFDSLLRGVLREPEGIKYGAARIAEILGLICIDHRNGVVAPGQTLRLMRPWWEQ